MEDFMKYLAFFVLSLSLSNVAHSDGDHRHTMYPYTIDGKDYECSSPHYYSDSSPSPYRSDCNGTGADSKQYLIDEAEESALHDCYYRGHKLCMITYSQLFTSICTALAVARECFAVLDHDTR